MKILLDQNVSYKLVAEISALFGVAEHVRLLGLDTADDAAVWECADENAMTIVTFDRDFSELSFHRGYPPKVIIVVSVVPTDTLCKR